MDERARIAEPAWFDVTASLLEAAAGPTAVVDLTGTVRAANRCLATLLGQSPGDLIGKPWPESDPESGGLRRILRRLRGPRGAKHTSWVTTSAQVPLALDLEATRVGKGPRAAVVLSVLGFRLGGRGGAAASDDLEYVIKRGIATFGAIVSIRACGRDVLEWRSFRCFEVIQGRGSPCPECPAKDLPACGVGSTAVLTPSSPEEPIVVVIARALDAGTARVVRFRVDEGLLTRLLEAKSRALAERAGLSPREREVFGQIVLGRDAADIGARLGISTRTVKFHQARALDKLGADSRVDLLRLIF